MFTVSTQTDGQGGIVHLSQVVYHIKKIATRYFSLQSLYVYALCMFSNLKLHQNSITHTANDITAHMNKRTWLIHNAFLNKISLLSSPQAWQFHQTGSLHFAVYWSMME